MYIHIYILLDTYPICTYRYIDRVPWGLEPFLQIRHKIAAISRIVRGSWVAWKGKRDRGPCRIRIQNMYLNMYFRGHG